MCTLVFSVLPERLLCGSAVPGAHHALVQQGFQPRRFQSSLSETSAGTVPLQKHGRFPCLWVGLRGGFLGGFSGPWVLHSHQTVAATLPECHVADLHWVHFGSLNSTLARTVFSPPRAPCCERGRFSLVCGRKRTQLGDFLTSLLLLVSRSCGESLSCPSRL